MDEAGLIAKVRKGDADALAELADLYRPRLCSYVRSNMSKSLQRKIDPDDLVQETILSCVRSLPDIDLADREPFSWMCQIAQRRIMDAGRKFSGTQKRDTDREVSLQGSGATGTDQAGLVGLLVASITSPSQAFSRGQREFRLLEALGQLPEEQQKAIRLRFVDGLSTKDIAEQLGKSDGAIRVMLTRSMKKLGEMMDQY